MKVIETCLPGVMIVEPKVFGDGRGFFLETFQAERYRAELGIYAAFVQDNHSRSVRGVLRGLHSQVHNPQGKLVRVIRGKILDVAVDIDPESATFGCHEAVILSDENQRQLWVPPGYAHGFAVLSDVADVAYKCTEYYDPSDEAGIVWNDPQLAIDWQLQNPILSDKDAALPTLAQYVCGIREESVP
ncbi:dTDP-4-dehydrorhamnose 3,5-epimerase [Microbulbifer donghaiensis]|uniref:dTDP-4-dehydrorhamnose 3,5-epimerase n=1 Tax=Microbulbifer donghaiensis TaxID=494016 RepID=A0A1M5CIT0_9GAMM|nr:dTDP-4-dehydrorhamnose 3,5-epimerase [Microbulbifer donghaiensis]SHF54638.1 dTDP-4-dehydrorhamnose 3,5-epimerase [Microbulbifer donghaiensis]